MLTTNEKKALFGQFLSNISGGAGFDLTYVWKRRDLIFHFDTADGKPVKLSVNLNVGDGGLFNGNDVLSVTYRASFITGYVRLIEEAVKAVPDTYFEGLVLLNVIDALCRGGGDVFNAGTFNKRTRMRAAEVHCSISALTSLLSERSDQIDAKTEKACREQLQMLVCFSSLPEIGYDARGRSVYSSLDALRTVLGLICDYPEAVDGYALFDGCKTSKSTDLSLGGVIETLTREDGEFAGALALRCIALLGVGCIPDGHFARYISDFNNRAVGCYSDSRKNKTKYVKDNLTAVKAISDAIERRRSGTVSGTETGMLHYIH